MRQRTAFEKLRKPWFLTFTIGPGYNSNVTLKGKELPLPIGISQGDDGFFQAGLDAGYQWDLDDNQTFSIGYSFDSRTHYTLSDFDQISHLAYSSYQISASETISGSLTLGGDIFLIGGDHFRSQGWVRPGLSWQWNPYTTSELSFLATFSDYKTSGPPAFDRDGYSLTPTLMQTWALWPRYLTAYTGYSFEYHQTDGTEFNRHGHILYLGLQANLPWQVFGDLTYSRSWNYYRDASIISGFRRRDHIDSLDLRLTRPINEFIAIFLSWSYYHANSNIRFYSNEGNSVFTGVTVGF